MNLPVRDAEFAPLFVRRGAARLTDDIAGETALYRGERIYCSAELKMGRGNSGKLVSTVKDKLLKNAQDTDIAVIDGSPGIGCPVIASVSSVDAVLIVTEPTLSGLSDLERIFRTVTVLNTKAAVCVNKADLNDGMTEKIQVYCDDNKIPFIGTVPYDKQASAAINSGCSIADIDCPARIALQKIYEKMMLMLGV